jgi:hypothetical protein
MATLDQAQMNRADASLIQEEYRWLGDILRLSVKMGMARAQTGLDQPVRAMNAASRRALAEEMRPLLDRFSALWVQRTRPGGLEDGLARFKRMLAALEE